jgi:thymidylate kinase
MSRPVIIELTGLPAAGKTSAARLLTNRLRRSGVACKMIDEAAQRNPLQDQKCEWHFNAWSSFRTVMDLLDARRATEAGVVVVDRGLVDAQCWMLWFRLRREIDDDTYQRMRDFLRSPNWARDTALVVELRVGFDTALRRRSGDTGRIFNWQNFPSLEKAYESTIGDGSSRHADTTLARIDTDRLSIAEVVNRIENLLSERSQTSRGTGSAAGWAPPATSAVPERPPWAPTASARDVGAFLPISCIRGSV